MCGGPLSHDLDLTASSQAASLPAPGSGPFPRALGGPLNTLASRLVSLGGPPPSSSHSSSSCLVLPALSHGAQRSESLRNSRLRQNPVGFQYRRSAALGPGGWGEVTPRRFLIFHAGIIRSVDGMGIM